MSLKIYPEDMRPVDKDAHSRLWPIARGPLKSENKKHALAELDVVNSKREIILKRYPELVYFEHLTIPKIAEIVSEYYGLRTSEVFSHRRNRQFVHARFVVYFFCRELLSKSYPEIARRLGRRDHTTIMHGIKRVIQMLETDEKLASDIENTRKILLEVRKNRAVS